MAELKALAKRLYDEISNSATDVDAFIEQYVAQDFVEHEALPGMDETRETPRQMFKMMRAAFPDFRMHVEDLIQEGDKVVARITVTGTHKGEFMGVPASGNEIDVSLIDIIRFRDDKMFEHWGVMDMAALMEQMGVTG